MTDNGIGHKIEITEADREAAHDTISNTSGAWDTWSTCARHKEIWPNGTEHHAGCDNLSRKFASHRVKSATTHLEEALIDAEQSHAKVVDLLWSRDKWRDQADTFERSFRAASEENKKLKDELERTRKYAALNATGWQKEIDASKRLAEASDAIEKELTSAALDLRKKLYQSTAEISELKARVVDVKTATFAERYGSCAVTGAPIDIKTRTGLPKNLNIPPWDRNVSAVVDNCGEREDEATISNLRTKLRKAQRGKAKALEDLADAKETNRGHVIVIGSMHRETERLRRELRKANERLREETELHYKVAGQMRDAYRALAAYPCNGCEDGNRCVPCKCREELGMPKQQKAPIQAGPPAGYVECKNKCGRWSKPVQTSGVENQCNHCASKKYPESLGHLETVYGPDWTPQKPVESKPPESSFPFVPPAGYVECKNKCGSWTKRVTEQTKCHVCTIRSGSYIKLEAFERELGKDWTPPK